MSTLAIKVFYLILFISFIITTIVYTWPITPFGLNERINRLEKAQGFK